jgi:DNA primase small subunit
VVLDDQDCWKNDPEQWEKVLNLLPDKGEQLALFLWGDDEVRQQELLRPVMFPRTTENSARLMKTYPPSSNTSSRERWGNMVPAGYNSKLKEKLLSAREDIIIQYTYPRIDTEVSRKLNHLLKAPFCVHPGTGELDVYMLPCRARVSSNSP